MQFPITDRKIKIMLRTTDEMALNLTDAVSLNAMVVKPWHTISGPGLLMLLVPVVMENRRIVDPFR